MNKENMIESETGVTQTAEFKTIEWFAVLLDNRFRIPGTSIRFGFDFLIGLIPYAGDVLTFIFSGFLVLVMAKHGASGVVMLKMFSNILLDTIVGTVPLAGDIFDLKFRANLRNYQLLKEHYLEKRHEGKAWPVILTVFFVLAAMVVFLLYLSWKMLYWIFS